MLKLFTALTIAFSAPTLALAATDGTLGDSSSGTANITFNVTDAITPKIQISGLQDLTLQSTSASLGDIKPSSPVCVYMTEAGSFALTVTAEPLLFGTDVLSGYYVNFTDHTSAERRAFGPVGFNTHTQMMEGYTPSQTADCANDEFSELEISIRDPDVPEIGTATAAITLTVAPD